MAASAIVAAMVAGGTTYAVMRTASSSRGYDATMASASRVEQSDAVVRAVEKANPAVVSIVVSKDVPVIEQYYEDVSPFGALFGDRFSRFLVPRYRERGTERREIGGGSGFIISPDGYIVTNRHVVDDAEASYAVFTNDGKKYDSRIVFSDESLDIALIKIEASGLEHLAFADSDDIKVGQSVIAIGNALGEFRNTVSVGVVSGLARSIVAGDEEGNTETLDEVIQTDAAINPGNSGGPLVDLSGKVVGVNIAVVRDSENIGFALPANVVRRAVEGARR
jgi:serine protease Do